MSVWRCYDSLVGIALTYLFPVITAHCPQLLFNLLLKKIANLLQSKIDMIKEMKIDWIVHLNLDRDLTIS